MTYITNLRRPSLITAVSETASSYGTPAVPPVDAHAARIAREAEQWLAFASERSRMTAPTLQRKALASCAFSVARGAQAFAVPSKLSGTSQHQRRLWTMVRELAAPWSELTLGRDGGGLTALYDGDPIGEVQPKHLPWLRPLAPFGARLYLSTVTGSQRDHATLGCNVVVGHVGTALNGLLGALGTGDGHGGDGSNGGAQSAPESTLELVVSAGDSAQQAAFQGAVEGSSSHLRLVVLPGSEALSGDADDVILWREIDGTARASVPHEARHSPTGINWGYGGAGPADLALSVLLALVPEQAEELFWLFSKEVVARVPYAGGVLRAADVRDWARAQTAPRPAA